MNTTSNLEIVAQGLISARMAENLTEAIAAAAAANPALYTEYLATLGKNKIATPEPRRRETLFEVSARALVNHGEAENFEEACAILARDCPASYERYLTEIQ